MLPNLQSDMLQLAKKAMSAVRAAKREFSRKSIQKDWYFDEPAVAISSRRRRELKKKGFLASSDIAFDFERFGTSEYITDRDFAKLHPFNKSLSPLIDNKAFVPCLLPHLRRYFPETSVYVVSGTVSYFFSQITPQGDLRSQLEALLARHEQLFAKPTGESGGKGSFVVNKTTLPEALVRLKSGRWLLNERLVSEAYSASIYGGSINTFRVVFYRTRAGTPKLFRVFHRFGTDESGTVDNCSRGGMVCSVDLDSGRLSPGLIYLSKTRKGRFTHHVSTGAPLEGLVIPDWGQKLAAIHEVVANLWFLNFGGIDLAPTKSGLKILEINSLPSSQLLQTFEPALRDAGFAEFLARMGFQAGPHRNRTPNEVQTVKPSHSRRPRFLEKLFSALRAAKRELVRRRVQDDWYIDEPTIAISPAQRRDLRRAGFLASAAILFDFERHPPELYVNHRAYQTLHPLSGNTSLLIDNKAFVPLLFAHVQRRLPELGVYLDGGCVMYAYGCPFPTGRLPEVLSGLADRTGEIFAKRVDGSGGKGSFAVRTEDLPALQSRLSSGKWLVNNRLRNEAYAERIFGGSLNTFRIVFFKRRDGSMRIFRISHRFGTLESGAVDNCSQGGMACSVALDSGVMSSGAIYGSAHNNGYHQRHVDTGEILESFAIPGWQEKLADIQATVDALHFLNFGGIDMAPTPYGLRLLEINSLPSMRLMQTHAPALLDAEFADFMKRMGYQA